MYPKVSIIILNWNGKEDTIECLASLKKINYPNYEIILVDNGSNDGSVEHFMKNYPEIEIIANKENLGFPEGNNVGIRRVINRGTDYILLLNNDTIVDSYFLKELVKVAEADPEIGIVGPTVCYFNENNKIQTAGAKIWWNRGKVSDLRRNEIDNGKVTKTTDVDYVCGCALLAKIELFKKIGYLNRDYFLYWEDTDWCVRAHEAGYRILHVPKAKIWHKEGSTSRKTSGLYEYQITRNMFWFMKQHATNKQYISFLFYFLGFKFWFSTGAHLIYFKNVPGYLGFLRGIKDGLKNSPPKSQ